jgi:hypothetical protein
VRTPAQHRPQFPDGTAAGAKLATTSWLFVTFDTAGEVMFMTVSTLLPQLFKHLSNLNGAHLALRQQYHFW